jgi:hypothetical protein
MRMKQRRWVPVIAFITISGCYLKPMSTSLPVQSREGVRVQLLGEDCEDHRGAEGIPISRSLSAKLRIENPTREPLRFSPESVYMSVKDWSVTPLSSGTFEIAPGERRDVVLDFSHHSVCNNDFKIAFGQALALGAQPIQIGDLWFNPLGQLHRQQSRR